MSASVQIGYIRAPVYFGYILLVSIRFNAKSSKYHKFLLAFYGIFRKLSYLYHPEFRRSLYIAKYRNEQNPARFHIVTCFV